MTDARHAPPTVDTPRLWLRPQEPGDVDALFAIQGDADAMRHTCVAPDREATVRHLEAYAARFAEDGYAPWTAVLRDEDRVIGLAGELVRAALALAFQELALSEVRAFTRPENTASRRVLEKAGFTRVRYVPELERDLYRVARDGFR